jgi:hypothetical protein
VKYSEAAEFESKTAVGGRRELLDDMIMRVDSLQFKFVIVSAQR